MYTRCPECETTFKVTAEDLRRAQGRVRCGDCQHVFNAVAYLTEEPDKEDDALPTLQPSRGVLSSAGNPHRDPDTFAPANETGAFEIDPAAFEQAQADDIELEIKAYDEKTGRSWSALESADANDNADEPDEAAFGTVTLYSDDGAFETTVTPKQYPRVSLRDTAADELTDGSAEGAAEDNDVPMDPAIEPPAWAMGEDDPDEFHDTGTGLDASLLAPSDKGEPQHSLHVIGADDDLKDDLDDGYSPKVSDDDWEPPSPEMLATVRFELGDYADSDSDDDDATNAAATDEDDLSGIEALSVAEPPSSDSESHDEPDDEFDDDLDNEIDNGLDDEFAAAMYAVEDDDDDENEGDAIVSFSAPGETAAPEYDDYLPEDEAAADDSDDAQLEDEEYFSAAAEDADDFDDTIWERIPGVGAAEKARAAAMAGADDDVDNEFVAEEDRLADGLSYTGTDYPIVDSKPHELAETADSDAEDEGDPDSELGFDVPQDKWTSFFGEAPRPAAASAPRGADEAGDFAGDTVDHEPLLAVPGETVDQPRPDGVEGETREYHIDDLNSERAGPAAEAESAESTAERGDEADAWSKAVAGAEDLVATMSGIFGTDDREDEVTAEADDDDAEQDAAEQPRERPEWADMEPAEEVVLSTGRFGAAEIATFISQHGGDPAAADQTRTYEAEDWQPESWANEDGPDGEAGKSQPYWQAADAADSGGRTFLWLAGGLLLVLALVSQLIHYNRDALAAGQSYGAQLRSVYGMLGMELYPEWDIDSYEIRGSEAVVGETGPDVLDIRTQIASVSDEPVGLPHLRVVLRDRWSKPVAARNFTPAEYSSGELPADGILEPGESVPAYVAIVDPGAGAQGFELELCLPRRDTGLDCTGQPFK